MAAGEAVLLYHMEEEKARKLKTIFIQNGLRIKTVHKEEYLKPIGALAGVPGIPGDAAAYSGEEFAEEMLVFKGVYGKRLDLLLAAMRKARAQVALKAVLTERNLLWSSVELYRELRKEHAVMTGQEPEEDGPEEESLF